VANSADADEPGLTLDCLHFSLVLVCRNPCVPRVCIWFDYGVMQYDFGNINDLLDTQASCSSRRLAGHPLATGSGSTIVTLIDCRRSTVNSVEFAEGVSLLARRKTICQSTCWRRLWTREYRRVVQNYNEGLVVQKQQR
jgi:hypothetical protein